MMIDSTQLQASTLEDNGLQAPELDQDEVFVFPASFAQQRLWFLDQFEPNSPYYNIPSAVRLRGRLDHEVLERCVKEIVRRHEALRTTFAADGGKPVQVISPHLTIAMPVIDLSSWPEDQRQAEVMRLATVEARAPFDLARGPLLRVTLLQLDHEQRDHVILVTMHHIISDGWSIGVFVAELAALYDAFFHGRSSPLPELPIQYADFAHWQQEWLQGDVLQAHLAYWRERLGDLPPVLELPTDRPRPAVITNRGATHAIKLPKSLTEAIKRLSKQEGCTPFMTLLAAFQVLLHRYSGQTDISIGSPIANRNRGEIEGLIGIFINTLVFRSDLGGDPTFLQLLRQVREASLGAFAHQDLPFETLVEALQPERDMSHSPLFQVMFILQNAPARVQELPDLRLEFLDVDMGTATFDLTLSMAEEIDGYDASVEYNTDIFDATTIQRLLRHFQTLLEGVVAQPTQHISRLPLLSPAERQQLLLDWNATDRDYLQGRSLRLHDLFEAQVTRTPQAVAVVVAGEEDKGLASQQQLTYAELNRRANQLAHHLQQLGVDPETLVGIAMEKSLHTIVAVLGVHKAGGAYVPIDPTYPDERVAFMLADSGVSIVLTQETWLETLPTGNARAICLDRDWPIIARQNDANPTSEATPESLAYVIYTSGSTGQSKGVMVEHRSIVNQYLAWEEDYRLRDQATSHLQMAAFSFDVFTGDLARALCSGGRLVLVPREMLLAPDQLYALMHRERIDCAEFVPAVLRHLVQYMEDTNQTLDFIRLLICGSDSWYVAEYQRFLRLCGPHTRLINSFGLTEATIDSCFFEGSVDGLPADRLVPIGRPFGNTQLYVLDQHRQPAPVGVLGELFVGGVGAARGYLNQPDLTAQRFIPNPFAEIRSIRSQNPLRLYRTGDMARFLPDGNVEFLGRMDHQVKVRGFRIEPGEIEAVLGNHPQVRQAVVMARTAPSGDKRLVAYVVPAQQVPQAGPEDAALPSAGDMRRFLQERLADYMVPSAFVVLPALPLTPNGKVDRNALPEPDWSQRALAEEMVAPRTPTEDLLAQIWSQVLGLQEIGIFDDFFDLGGHSLLATQLISRVRDAFSIDLPLRNVFESPTIATLAEQIEILQRTAAGVQAPPIKPVPRDQELPLSFAQQRLWFLDQLEPGSPLYNLPEVMRLRGPLDEALLERSLNELVRRHEALRTTFRSVHGRPVQIIAPQLDVPLPVVDLSGLPAEEKEAAVQRLARAEAQTAFDLATGPLLRGKLLRLAEDDRILLLTMHHIVGDDWSSSVAVREITILYDAFAQGQPSPLPELPIQYADFAHWQRHWLQGEMLDTQLNYWKQALAGLPPLLDLPTDRPRPPEQTFSGDYVSFSLPPGLSQGIRELCQREGVTLFMGLLAAFQTLLHRYSGQRDIAIGTPIANRNRVEIEGLIGFFVNTLVLRTSFQGTDGTNGTSSATPSFRQVLQQVREAALGAYAHQDLPFEMIVDAVQPQRNLSHSPLFQVMFALQNTPLDAQVLSDAPGNRGPQQELGISGVEVHSGTAKFDLTLFMVEEGECLSGAMEFNTDLFDRSTVERMIGHLQRVLQAVVAEPGQPVSAVPLMSEEECQQILVTWNATAAPYPSDQCLHQLVEEMAVRQPDALAVAMFNTVPGPDTGKALQLMAGQWEKQALTYAELDQRANQLGHHLRRLGVGPETVVGICAQRTPDMVVGLLGVLKAGGAYLPIDPSYPPERITYMLQDSGTTIVLTQERLLPVLPQASDVTVIQLDTDWPTIAAESADPVPNLAGPHNLAYVIYTSGSTGRPKGAMIVHQGLTNYLTWCLRAYPLDAGNGAPVHSSISFDLTVTSLWAPLVAGRQVTLLPDDVGVEALLAAMRHAAEGGYSLIKITPAHLELLGQQLSPEEAAGRTQAFIIGGENLLAETIAFWQQNAPETLLINEYGPTETVVGCCVFTAPPEPMTGSVPIGLPIINTQLYILDPHLQPVPIGVTGELYIAGNGVARGYLGRPSLTAERFVPNPFLNAEVRKKDGSATTEIRSIRSQHPLRLYRTGDLARYRADGTIEYLGRTDHQVKILGFRIELGEIDAVLNRYPAVKDAITVARETEPGAPKRLVAYVVPQASTALESEDGKDGTSQHRDASAQSTQDGQSAVLSIVELRSHLRQSLPDHMVPSSFVMLDALPLTHNGKVDRDALPAPELVGQPHEDTFVPLRTPEEEIVASIWADTLGVPVNRIGAHDNFFELGGHSLLATQVVSRLRDIFAVELPLRELFEAPTIAALAERVGTARQAAHGLTAPPIRPVARDQETPLSFAQQRLWFLDQLEPGNAFYNIPAGVRLQGKLDVTALEQAINAVIRRHEALRTTFHTVDGRARQVIHPEMPLAVPVVDLSRLPEAQREAEARRQAGIEALRPFDLSTGPLMRVHVWRLNEQEHIALLNMHHIVSDDWSMGVLIQEVATLYAARSSDLPEEAASLPRLPVQYADFAHWQRQWLEGVGEGIMSPLQQQLRYWKDKLAGMPPLLELPTDRPRPAIQSFHGGQRTFLLPEDVTQALRRLSREEGTTLFMTLLAAFQTLLYRYTGQADFAVGTPIANRNRSEIEGLIGFFVNTLVMRTALSGDVSFRELNAQVRETALEAYAHQDVPFEMLVDALHLQRDMSHSPLFQVMFVLQNAPQRAQQLTSDLVLTSIETEDAVARFDLTLTMVEDADGLGGSLEYSTDLYDDATIERMVDHFQALLKSIVADPDQPLAGLSMLSAAEQQQILVDWNATTTDYPLDRCVHELFEAQATANPDATAVIYVASQAGEADAGDEGGAQAIATLSYAELNRRANQLAHALRAAGVGPETLVGICVERSPEMVIGLLGTLKAGGAYLPLDPDYPPDRLAYMIQDSGIPVLLTQTKVWDQVLQRSTRDMDTVPLRAHGEGFQLASLADQVPTVIRMDADWHEIAGHSIARQPTSSPADGVASNPQNLAYVIYTSGSTGRPKGVLVQHQGLTNLVCAQTQGFGVDSTCRVLQFASFSFDASVSETFMALATGATLVLAQQETLGSPPELVDLMREQAVTTVTLPPSMLKVLPPVELPMLHTLISAGEACSPDIAERWSRGRRFFNAYGPTETTIGPTYHEIPQHNATGQAGSAPARAANVPIGCPIANMQIYVLDPYGQPVPVGIAGEICIGGVGVARGYLDRPDLTAERFIPNPFLNAERGTINAEFGKQEKSATAEIRSIRSANSLRLYRTGDLGRWLPGGNLEFLGRSDHQVKVRGFRIELGEIETALAEHPAVREAVVLASEDQVKEPGYTRLVGYIVPHVPDTRMSLDQGDQEIEGMVAGADIQTLPGDQEPELTAGELRSFLAGTLPDYMIPSAFVVLEAMPLTPNGKVDRRALPALGQERLRTAAEYVAPRNTQEETLAQIWAEVLNVQQVGVYDDFFELGGDSILSIQVVSRASQAGLRLAPRDLFQHPTVAGLAAVAQAAPATATQREGSDQEPSEDYADFGWSQEDVDDILAQLDTTG